MPRGAPLSNRLPPASPTSHQQTSGTIAIESTCEAVVIGGGFYGLYLAEYLTTRFRRVKLFERGPRLMQRASYRNQARVHNGYHYPRSVLTAVRSRVNFPRFVEEFRSTVDSTFEKVYAIARRHSKVNGEQFHRSMKWIGAPIRPAPKDVASLFDPAYIEAAFITEEHAFNSESLCKVMEERVGRAGVEVFLDSPVASVASVAGGVQVSVHSRGGTTMVAADHAFCCGYSQLNAPGAGGGLPPIPLKHELTEMALVQVPDRLRGLGITVMDGPFFSLMPFPARRLHTLSHVRYTPHTHWYDGGKEDYTPSYELLDAAPKHSAFPHMIRDASRYLPAIADCRQRDSLWEVKTILPRSETDDSRPILFRPHHGIPNYHLVMGGKIDNVYDLTEVIGETFGWTRE